LTFPANAVQFYQLVLCLDLFTYHTFHFTDIRHMS